MSDELARQYRVLQQMVDMHARLRDRYERKALLLDLLILTGSVVFAATTFANEATFRDMGLSGSTITSTLQIVSVALFAASVASLRVDWKGVARGHADAVRLLAGLVSDFRERRAADGSWPEEAAPLLHQRYSDVMNSIVSIPTRDFTRLKARYLRAKEVSRLLDGRPGRPHWVATLTVMWQGIRKK